MFSSQLREAAVLPVCYINVDARVDVSLSMRCGSKLQSEAEIAVVELL